MTLSPMAKAVPNVSTFAGAGEATPKLKESLLGIRISIAGKNCFKVRDFELSGFIEQHHRVESRTVVGVLSRQNFQNLGRGCRKEILPTTDDGQATLHKVDRCQC